MPLVFVVLTLFVTATFWIPPLQRRLRRKNTRQADTVAALLAIVPGTLFALLYIVFVAMLDDHFTRVTLLLALMDTEVFTASTASFWTLTCINAIVWNVCEVLLYRKARATGQTWPSFPNRLLIYGLPCLILFTVVSGVYLSGYKTLQYAVEHGDLELARKRLRFNLLGVGANDGHIWRPVPSLPTFTEPLLFTAASRGDIAMARLLIEHGAWLNDGCGYYLEGSDIEPLPIFGALRNRHVEMAKYLLAQGANPSLALEAAVRENNVEVLKQLLDFGADPSIRDSQRRTLLDVAISKRANEAYDLLSKYIPEAQSAP